MESNQMNALTEPTVKPAVVTPAADPIESFRDREYSAGFVTEIESVTIPKGLSEDTIRLLSAKKGEPEFMLEWRLAAYRHWLTMDLPEWAKVSFPAIDFQDISSYSAPKSKKDGPKSLDEVDRSEEQTSELQSLIRYTYAGL